MTRRTLILLVLLIAAAATLWWVRLSPDGGDFNVEVPINSIRHSNFEFIPEHWAEPQLRQLRDQEDYADFSAKDTTELFLKLCHWVHSQWERSVPDPYPRANALDILSEIRAGRTGGFCGQYAYVLADVLKSMGFFAVRYVELWGRRAQSHFVVEAWNDDLGKWMVLDPDQDLVYYREDGVPANALEVRSGLLEKRKITAQSAAPGNRALGQRHMNFYAHFAVSLRSDFMRSDRPPTVKDRFDSFLFFRDDLTDLATFKGRIPYSLVTRRVSDIYFDCNAVRMEWSRLSSRDSLRFRFFTEGSAPNFQAFGVRLGNRTQWIPIQGNEMVVDVDELPVTFSVAAINRAGRRGRVSRVDIRHP